MARRRLAPVASLDPAAMPLGVPRAERPGGATAPIAQVAAEAAAGAALEEMAATLRAAREEGRFVLDLPFTDIASDHLVRDRILAEDEEMVALKESIRVHGQRTPIEVTPLDREAGTLPYGLVSGWRRLTALTALHAETGEPRFARVRALVLRPESAEAAYVAMVEENELRVGLSQYERARIAARATERGVFPDIEAALRTLFATASRPKRSRIRAFLELYDALDTVLRFPQAIPERLGLRLVEHLREGQGPEIAARLSESTAATAEEELALLESLARPVRPLPARPVEAELRPGVRMGLSGRDGAWTLILKGRGVSPAFAEELRTLLQRLDA
jgi:ParB family transcriptional regulator, chromosome partitioning protein